MKFICPAPWQHHCVNTNGSNRLCCNSETSSRKFIDDFESYWQKDLNVIRQEFINGNKPVECKNCWDRENLGLTSQRQNFLENLKTKNELEDFLNNLHFVKEYPIELDLKLGNYCNLSCRMCSSYSSSSYAKEFKQIYEQTKIDYGIDDFEKNYVQNKWYNSKKFISLLEKIINAGLKKLKFTGGEPLMVPSVKTILENCVLQDKAKDIELVIITNATLINETWLDLFKKFKHTSIIVSIDGVGTVYEYIRHPSKWQDFMVKLELLKDCNIYKMLAFTLQVYNVLDIKNIIDLSRNYNFDLSLIPLHQPEYLDVQYVPKKLQEHALYMLDEINPTTIKEIEFVQNIKNKLKHNENRDDIKNTLLKISMLKDKYKKQDFTAQEIYKYYG